MNCCGKCYLKKQLAKDSKQQPSPIKKGRTELQYIISQVSLLQDAQSLTQKQLFPSGNEEAISLNPGSVFRPPCV